MSKKHNDGLDGLLAAPGQAMPSTAVSANSGEDRGPVKKTVKIPWGMDVELKHFAAEDRSDFQTQAMRALELFIERRRRGEL